MLFTIYCLDRPGTYDTRLKMRPEHKKHLAQSIAKGVQLKLSGPLVADDNATMIGSLFVVEVPNREAAEAFYKSDPFCRHGVWETCTVKAMLDLTQGTLDEARKLSPGS